MFDKKIKLMSAFPFGEGGTKCRMRFSGSVKVAKTFDENIKASFCNLRKCNFLNNHLIFHFRLVSARGTFFFEKAKSTQEGKPFDGFPS